MGVRVSLARVLRGVWQEETRDGVTGGLAEDGEGGEACRVALLQGGDETMQSEKGATLGVRKQPGSALLSGRDGEDECKTYRNVCEGKRWGGDGVRTSS